MRVPQRLVLLDLVAVVVGEADAEPLAGPEVPAVERVVDDVAPPLQPPFLGRVEVAGLRRGDRLVTFSTSWANDTSRSRPGIWTRTPLTASSRSPRQPIADQPPEYGVPRPGHDAGREHRQERQHAGPVVDPDQDDARGHQPDPDRFDAAGQPGHPEGEDAGGVDHDVAALGVDDRRVGPRPGRGTPSRVTMRVSDPRDRDDREEDGREPPVGADQGREPRRLREDVAEDQDRERPVAPDGGIAEGVDLVHGQVRVGVRGTPTPPAAGRTRRTGAEDAEPPAKECERDQPAHQDDLADKQRRDADVREPLAGQGVAEESRHRTVSQGPRAGAVGSIGLPRHSVCRRACAHGCSPLTRARRPWHTASGSRRTCGSLPLLKAEAAADPPAEVPQDDLVHRGDDLAERPGNVHDLPAAQLVQQRPVGVPLPGGDLERRPPASGPAAPRRGRRAG